MCKKLFALSFHARYDADMTLNEYMQANGLSVKQMSEQIGCKPITVYMYLSGKRKPRDVRRIVEATNGAVTANDFYL